MTPSEFNAWFRGFTEGIEGIPSKEQWDRVLEEVKKLADAPVVFKPYPTVYVYGQQQQSAPYKTYPICDIGKIT